METVLKPRFRRVHGFRMDLYFLLDFWASISMLMAFAMVSSLVSVL